MFLTHCVIVNIIFPDDFLQVRFQKDIFIEWYRPENILVRQFEIVFWQAKIFLAVTPHLVCSDSKEVLFSGTFLKLVKVSSIKMTGKLEPWKLLAFVYTGM